MLVGREQGADLGLDDLRWVEVGESGRLLDRLDHRVVRDPLAVGQAPSRQDGDATAETGQELLDQTRLADARGPEHRDELAGAVLEDRVEPLPELGELPPAPDHRRPEGPRDGSRDVEHPEEPPRGDPFGLALQGERIDRFRLDDVADQPIRVVPDEDPAGRGVLLEPGGDVDGVARDERLPRRRVPGDDLAGVHADAHLDRDAAIAPELLVQCGQPFAHLDRRAHGPQRVVLVELGDPEHRHHGVPDVLLDGPAVTLDRPAHRLEVARLHVAQRLGIQALAERRRAGQVAEHDRDRLADLALERAGRQGGRAGGAEGEVIGALATAVRTGQHPTSVGTIAGGRQGRRAIV